MSGFLSHLLASANAASGANSADHAAHAGALDGLIGKAREIVSSKTHTAVYNECHGLGVAEVLRTLLERAIDALPIQHPHSVLAGPVLALLHKLESTQDGKSVTGAAAFVRDLVQRNGLDAEVQRSASLGIQVRT